MSVINALPYGGGSGEKYKHKVEITESGTWTVPTGVTQIAVRLFGGGGGGSFGSPSSRANTTHYGGGGGYMAYKELTVTPGTVYAITIGAGGSQTVTDNGETYCYASGSAGGATSFGDLLTAAGGGAHGDNYGGTGGGGSGTGRGSYGGGGGKVSSNYTSVTANACGIYGGAGGTSKQKSSSSSTAETVDAQAGWFSMAGSGYAAGGGGYKADGGDGDAGSSTSSPSYTSVYPGGGGGWEGGKGGSGKSRRTSTDGKYAIYCAGGGGGYGSKALTDVECGGGYGYGAGGGGGYYIPWNDDGTSITYSSTRVVRGSGAPGICIIYY